MKISAEVSALGLFDDPPDASEPTDALDTFLADAKLAGCYGQDGHARVAEFRKAVAGIGERVRDIYRRSETTENKTPADLSWTQYLQTFKEEN